MAEWHKVLSRTVSLKEMEGLTQTRYFPARVIGSVQIVPREALPIWAGVKQFRIQNRDRCFPYLAGTSFLQRQTMSEMVLSLEGIAG